MSRMSTVKRLGRVNTTHRFEDQCEMDEGYEHNVELVEAGEDAPKSLEPAEQPLDFIASSVHEAVVLPWLSAIAGRRDHRHKAEIQGQLARLVTSICAIHEQMNRAAWRAQATEQLSASRGVVCLAGRQRERYGRSSIRGNHMNLCGPSSARLADGLRAVFLEPPCHPDGL